MKEKAGEPSQNPATLVCTVALCQRAGSVGGWYRELMGLSDLGSPGKKAFEEKKNIVTKTS